MSEAPQGQASATDAEGATDAPIKTAWWMKIIIVLGALPPIMALGIMGFISWYSMAHNEERCPYHHVVTRPVGDGASVREDARRCIDAVEEHRWVVERGTAEPRELGRYPLEAAQVDRGFPWTADIEDGRVVIHIENEGRGEFVLREPTEEEMM